jgi:hypothetical protein
MYGHIGNTCNADTYTHSRYSTHAWYPNPPRDSQQAVHATRRIRKVSVGLERQADSVAVVELAAVRMSDSDDEVIIASSSKENFGMKYDTNCKTVSTGKFKGKNRKATKPAGKQPAKVGCKTDAFTILTGPKAAAPLDRGKGAGRKSNKTSCFYHEHWNLEFGIRGQ